MTDSTASWAHVPGSPPAPTPSRRWVDPLAVAAIGLVGPVTWMVTHTTGSPIAGATIGAMAVWAVVGLVVARWGITGRPPSRILPVPGPGAAVPVAVLFVVAAWVGAGTESLWRPMIPFALGCVVPLLSTVGDGALDRVAHRVGRVAGNAVSFVCFGLLGLLVVVLPWGVQRLGRVDPLRPTHGWVRRGRRSLQPAATWAPDPALRPAGASTPARVLVGLLAVALLVVTLVPSARDALLSQGRDNPTREEGFRLLPPDPADGEPLDEPSDADQPGAETLDEPVDPNLEAYQPGAEVVTAAQADAEWFVDPAYRVDLWWALGPQVANRPINPHIFTDFRSKYVNVIGGHRQTWTPPPCDCKRLTVWVYGGSTTWGLGQRDDHTIPSELARAAYRDGLVLDVRNAGNLGNLHWMEAEHFAWDLTTDDPPDLVLFYDGVNEAWATSTLIELTSEDAKPMIDPTTVQLWNSTGRSDGPVPAGPPGSKLLTLPGGAVDVPTRAETTVERYDRSRQLSRTAAAAHGTPVRYFWQPSRVSRPLILDEPHYAADNETYLRLLEQLMVENLPDDVIDLTDVFDDNTEPLFTDDAHHNEEGARIVAEAMYATIEDDLIRLRDGEDVDP